MSHLRVFADLKLDDATARLLREGLAPHELVLPAKPAASVLAASGPDPALAEVDIAFGQPDVGGILASKRIRWLHLSSAGYTRFDHATFREAAAARGLAVTNSSTVYAEACAEHVFSFMLAQARALPLALRTHCANGTGEWLELRESGSILRGQSAVILGYGAIAERLVAFLRPFEMSITALRRRPRGDEPVPIVTEEGLAAVLATADHIINILPDNAASVRFLDATRLAACRRGAVLYNIGRGTTVEQTALLEALESGQLAAAWLDVTDPEPLPEGHPLRSQPNCYITPHTAGGHRHESQTLVRHFLQNFRLFLEGAPLRDRIM